MPLLVAATWETPQAQKAAERLLAELQARMPHIERVSFPQACIAYGEETPGLGCCLPLHDDLGQICGFGLGTFFQQQADLILLLQLPINP